MKFFFLLLVLSFASFLHAQDKVQWSYSFNNEAKVIEISADIAEGWHLYSQNVTNDIGPVPTAFTFESNPSVKFIGKVSEPQPIQKYDENFEAMLDFFEEKVVFSQRVSVKENTTIHGTVTFMVCNETMCLPPVDKLFTIELIAE